MQGVYEHQAYDTNDEMQGLWQNEEALFQNNRVPFLKQTPSNYEELNLHNMIGQKRSMPSNLNDFGINSREYSQLRPEANHRMALVPTSSNLQIRSGIRSAMPEKYEESPYPKPRIDLTQSTIKCLKTPDIEQYYNEQKRIEEKYNQEQKLLVEKMRQKARLTSQNSLSQTQNFVSDSSHQQQQQIFKKPTLLKKSNRGAARPPVIKEGDWLCPNQTCCNINWSKRSGCNL